MGETGENYCAHVDPAIDPIWLDFPIPMDLMGVDVVAYSTYITSAGGGAVTYGPSYPLMFSVDKIEIC